MALSPDQILHVAGLTGLEPHAVSVLSRRWTEKTLPAGTVLWKAGDDGARVLWILKGRIEVWAHRKRLAALGPGAMLGEVAGVFEGARHHTSARATEDSVVVAIRRPVLRHLRESTPESWKAVLRLASQTVADRRGAAYEWLSERAAGNTEPPEKGRRGNLAIVTDRWLSAHFHGPPAPLEDFLAKLPALAGCQVRTMQSLVEAFDQEPLREGHALYLEDGEPSAAYLLTEGVLELMRTTPDGLALRVSILKPFAAAGLGAHVAKTPHATTCVSRARGWAYAMHAGGYDRLRPEAQLLWNELCLRSLGADLARVNELLASTL